MTSASLYDRSALDALEPRWRKRGYTVIRAPSQDQLPSFLNGFEPDAIAIGSQPGLVIEIVRPQETTGPSKLQKMRSLLEGKSEWQLEVVLADAGHDSLAPMDVEDVRLSLAEALELSKRHAGAALLLAWSALEALGRLLEPQMASAPLASGTLIDLLVSQGHLPQAAGDRLWKVAKLRDAWAHGQLTVVPADDDIVLLVDIAAELASSLRGKGQHDDFASTPPAA